MWMRTSLSFEEGHEMDCFTNQFDAKVTVMGWYCGSYLRPRTQDDGYTYNSDCCMLSILDQYTNNADCQTISPIDQYFLLQFQFQLQFQTNSNCNVY